MSRFGHSSNKTVLASENHNAPHLPDRSFRKKLRLLLIIGLSVLAIFFTLGFVIGTYFNRPPGLNQGYGMTSLENGDGPVMPDKGYKDGFYTFLVIGTDKDGYHTDTIMVVSLDTVGHKINIVSVPRDTQVDVPRNPKKINDAYAVGGVEQLKEEIKSILGFSPHYYIVVDLEAFKELVDAIGGVKFSVPQDMNWDDPAQDLHIHLKKGLQILDGNKALQLVRYRNYINADIGRIEIQQHFLMALVDELLTGSSISKIPEFADIFQQHVETDLSLRDMQWFARQVMQLDPEKDFTVQTLPYSSFGDYQGHNYVYLSAKEVISLVNRTINPYIRAITKEDIKIIRMED
ncbi:cell envelope-related function transcriptional attenuator common domain protein [Desulfoscipio gibsoniae DSM 7213]|uniref:Cell envelope-related function transcriptional attenuator common domain protein n=1 Tax=Desulfoscipio gibsoniae DSM 7213 TaxID=767817 RepID=R4KJQ3_9FIRM|nr:cell envelope-related function transcriptional attenuator common domain protein [Desulfoscipio gibsoniae DSM 7213]